MSAERTAAHLRECRPDEGWCAEGCPRYPMIESALRPPESPAAQDRFYARREWKAWAAGFATGALFVGLLWLVLS